MWKQTQNRTASHLLSPSLSSHQVDNTTPSTIKVFFSNHAISVGWERKWIFFSAIGRKLLVKADFFLLWVLFNNNVCINVFLADVAGPCLRPKAAVSKWKSEIIHFRLELVHMRRRSNTCLLAFSISHASAFPCNLSAFSSPATSFHLSLLWPTEELLLRGSCRRVGKGQSTTSCCHTVPGHWQSLSGSWENSGLFCEQLEIMSDVKVNSYEDGKLPFLCNLQKVDICLNIYTYIFNPQATEGGGDLNWRKEERMMNSGYWTADQRTAAQMVLK